ncbi:MULTISPECIES: hypothetical protein [Acidiphilium]|uniref:hypothetical protein n=1 Tax=Acidiphilium TaxID=522 RepID=UPI000A610D79|nr:MULTISPECIES: hypothetical protein [Acidiphilium]
MTAIGVLRISGFLYSFYIEMQGFGGWEGREGQGRIFFFVNKKEAKKTLLIWARARENARAPESESFLLLFFKKEALPYLP